MKYEFKTIEERNDFVTECYNKGIKYTYHNKNSEGVYKVETEDEQEQ